MLQNYFVKYKQLDKKKNRNMEIKGKKYRNYRFYINNILRDDVNIYYLCYF